MATLRERLIARLQSEGVGCCQFAGSREAAIEAVDAILAELRIVGAAPDFRDDSPLYAAARAIALKDSGTDLDGLSAGRGTYDLAIDCARAGIEAYFDALRNPS